MPGPFEIEDIEKAIYGLVVESGAREGDAFPTKFVWHNLESRYNMNQDDFDRGCDSLKKKGLLTEDEKLSDNFFSDSRNNIKEDASGVLDLIHDIAVKASHHNSNPDVDQGLNMIISLARYKYNVVSSNELDAYLKD